MTDIHRTSETVGKDTLHKENLKRKGSNTSDKIEFKTKTVARDKEGHYLIKR